MTHRDHRNGLEADAQAEALASGGFQEVLQLLVEHGFDGMAQAIQTLINEAMKLERSQALGARPYERTPERRGYANGYKPKTVRTRVGELQLAVPKTRGVEFYPSALQRGTRSERALKLAVAEMYLQGVSTRKVTAVMEELCGFEVTSMQVSRAVAQLDGELTQWRAKSLLAAWPQGRRPGWVEHVNAPLSEAELAAVRRAVQRGAPYGETNWCHRMVRRLGLESTLRPRGRPKKQHDGS